MLRRGPRKHSVSYLGAIPNLLGPTKEKPTGKAGEFVQKSLEVRINQSEWFLPPFSFEFEQKDAGELSEEDILVFVRGFSRLPSEPVIQNYQIRALEGAQYDLVFSNSISGVPQRRVNALWPGEESFVLDLSSLVSQAEFDKEEEPEEAKTFETIEDKSEETPSEVEGSSTFVSFLRQGFVHVLPLGLDHILFRLRYFYAFSQVQAFDSASLGLYGRSYHNPRPRNPRHGIRALRLGRTDYRPEYCHSRPRKHLLSRIPAQSIARGLCLRLDSWPWICGGFVRLFLGSHLPGGGTIRF